MTIDWFQFIGALVGIMGAYEVGSEKRSDRFLGFIFFAISNVSLIAWGIQQEAYWFITMQYCFAATTARGLWQTRPSKDSRP
jgi:nicotinamide riboside transporter PnuC